MSRERLERVIVEPAEARGVRYEKGLVSLIARDAEAAGGLPLLEFALNELWPYQRHRKIKITGYLSIGSVIGALSGYAERQYKDLLNTFSEERLRRVMLALVRSRAGAAQATCRIVSRGQLGEDWEVAKALAWRRLLVLDHDPRKREETAEVAHEALIREWPTLASWVNDDADFQHWRSALEERASDGEVLSDARIAEADRWLAERPNDIPPEVADLVERSKSEWRRRC